MKKFYFIYSVNGHERTYFNNTPDFRTEVASSEEYLSCKWHNCCVNGFGTHPHPPLRPPFPHEDLLNYCRQMDDVQQISMAFCESHAIFFFICRSQEDGIKIWMKNILAFTPRGSPQLVHAHSAEVTVCVPENV